MQKLCWMILAMIIVGGCSQNEQNSAINDNQRPNVTEVKNTTLHETDRQSGTEIAERLSNLAVKVPHVNDATSVVLGKYAIVGIDVDQDIDRSQVGTIKYSVGEALKQDPYGAYATIVADPDLNERIKEVADDIEKGQPIRGILNELSDITSRIIPEVPGDIVEQTPSKTINEQEQTIDNEKQQEMLEDKQNKQSNGHLD